MADIQKDKTDFSVDHRNLYREESYTDMKVATIRCLKPVKPDGSADKRRTPVFVGQTNIVTPNGPLPLQGVIQARDLQQAVKRFPEAMEKALQRLIEEAQKYKEESESRIIVPGRQEPPVGQGPRF